MRQLLVYSPLCYTPAKKYPVLYLLHGIGGTKREWYKYTEPDVILDNLLAGKKIVPMIVVFPNGRAMKNDADTLLFRHIRLEFIFLFLKDLLASQRDNKEAMHPHT